jgi:hypothetical protein
MTTTKLGIAVALILIIAPCSRSWTTSSYFTSKIYVLSSHSAHRSSSQRQDEDTPNISSSSSTSKQQPHLKSRAPSSVSKLVKRRINHTLDEIENPRKSLPKSLNNSDPLMSVDTQLTSNGPIKRKQSPQQLNSLLQGI